MNILTRQIMVGSFAFVIVGLMSTGILDAQDEGRRGRGGERFDAIRYLERADRDKNGMLDERELGGRLKEYVSGLGMDTSRPVPITKIKRAYEAKKKNDADAERMKTIDANRQVSQFGTDEELVPPPDFSVENLAGQNGRLEDRFDEEMVQTVKAYMRRYDENKDGSLDSNESQRIRRILGEEADVDKNGKLGEMEIAAALEKRKVSSESERRDRGRGDRGRGDRGRGDRGRGDRQPETPSRGNSRDFRGGTTSGSSGSASPSTPKRPSSGRSMTGRNSAYVDGLWKSYDKNGDGILDSDERKNISGSTNSKLVDENGDGQIDRREAINSLAGRATAAPEKPKPERPASSRRRPRRNSDKGDDEADKEEDSIEREEQNDRSPRSRSRGSAGSDIKYDIKGFQKIPVKREKQTDKETALQRRGASRDFLSRDKNTDGQISMGEFRDGKEWTDALVQSFQKLDENDDGVVTIEEFKDNYNSRDDD